MFMIKNQCLFVQMKENFNTYKPDNQRHLVPKLVTTNGRQPFV